MSQAFQGVIRDTLAPVLKDRPIILASEIFESSLSFAEQLSRHKARILLFDNHKRAKALGDRAIKSPQVIPPNKQSHLWDGAENLTWPLEALDKFDPQKRGLVVVSPGAIIDPGTRLFGRETWGGRSKSSANFENKSTNVEELLKPSGVPTAPSVVIPPGEASIRINELTTAFDKIDKGRGVVLSAGAEIGINGGAVGVLFVDRKEKLESAYKELTQDGAASIRITEFVPGISMGISAIVFPNGTVVPLLALEHYMFLKPDGRFTFAGMANSLRLDERTTKQLEDSVTRVGQLMHKKTGYTGVFGMDVVVKPEGISGRAGSGPTFIANEVNARFGAGADSLAKNAGMPWALFNAAIASHASVWPQGAPRFDASAIAKTIVNEAVQNPWAMPLSISIEGSHPQSITMYSRDSKGNWTQTSNDTTGVRVESAPTNDGKTRITATGLETSVSREKNHTPITAIASSLFKKVGEDLGIKKLDDFAPTFPLDVVLSQSTQSLGEGMGVSL